ncbi:hypothetical protein E2C01_006466 [Portunus trituberculatus]|uniref:Uncharacterized protein n=1 Tax=Portunus trituberculatus TaxID=210409 RepID=A0A5B7D1X0_PORTR|nr:hypothetical protein [Portunus trituberculatus]
MMCREGFSPPVLDFAGRARFLFQSLFPSPSSSSETQLPVVFTEAAARPIFPCWSPRRHPDEIDGV